MIKIQLTEQPFIYDKPIPIPSFLQNGRRCDSGSVINQSYKFIIIYYIENKMYTLL